MGFLKNLLPIVVLVLLCLIFFTGVWMAREDTNLEISAESVADFGMTAEEMQDYSLYKLYPYPNSPYVYCWFVKGSIIFSDDGEGEYWDIVNVVDLEKNKSVLRIRGHHYGGFLSSDTTTFYPLIYLDRQPVVLMRNWRSVGFGRSSNQMEDSFVRLDGSIEPALASHVGPFPIRGFNRFIKIHFDDAVLEELEGFVGGVKKLREWRYYCPHSIKFVLEDGTYCGFIPYRKEIVFYRPSEPPTYRVIPYAEAIHLFPGDDNRRVLIEPDFLTVLPQTEEKTVIFSCFTREKPGFPVYEIQTKHIDEGTADEIFKLVGNQFSMQPHKISYGQDHLYSGDTFFRREVNSDGSLGMFSNQPEAMGWEPAKRIWAEYQPYADRLLYYRDGGIWTSGLDGSDEDRVFP